MHKYVSFVASIFRLSAHTARIGFVVEVAFFKDYINFETGSVILLPSSEYINKQRPSWLLKQHTSLLSDLLLNDHLYLLCCVIVD
jgi:hypothetical protein